MATRTTDHPKRPMDRVTFERLAEVIYHLSGISLGERKQALLAARLGKRMRAIGIDDYEDYLRLIEADESGEELRLLLDAVATNVTSFFREPAHFEFLRSATIDWLESGQRRFRFWSAACSTGEEPLSLAMTLAEARAGYDADVRILATDISGRALMRCRDGIYRAEKATSIPPDLALRWFDPFDCGGERMLRAKPALLSPISYHRLNLSTPPFPMNGPMDAIFLRNVMIYFDNDVRRRLLAEAFRLLKPGGFLFVGHAESLTGTLSSFRAVRPSIYMKP